MQVFAHTRWDFTGLQTRSEAPRCGCRHPVCMPFGHTRWVCRPCMSSIEMLRFVHASHAGEGVPHNCMGVWADWRCHGLRGRPLPARPHNLCHSQGAFSPICFQKIAGDIISMTNGIHAKNQCGINLGYGCLGSHLSSFDFCPFPC